MFDNNVYITITDTVNNSTTIAMSTLILYSSKCYEYKCVYIRIIHSVFAHTENKCGHFMNISDVDFYCVQ